MPDSSIESARDLHQIQTLIAGLMARFGDLPSDQQADLARDLQRLQSNLFNGLASSRQTPDLDSQVRASALLEYSEGRFRQILDNSLEGIWTINPQGITEYVNPNGAEILGYSVEEIAGKPAFPFLFSQQDMANAERTLASLMQGFRGTLEAHACHKDGHEVILFVTTSPILNAQGEFQGAMAMFTDITEQKKLEAENQEIARRVAFHRQQLENREKERQVIARDIHDGPVQVLSATLFHLQAMKSTEQDSTNREALDQVVCNIRAVTQELRAIINDLRPPLLKFGLVKAIQNHIELMQSRHGWLEISFQCEGREQPMPDLVSLSLFRIFQEALNNVVRHSAADNCFIRLIHSPQQVALEVRDDGVGFAVVKSESEQNGAGQHGLTGMRERAEAIGAGMAITTSPEGGTLVVIQVSLDGNASGG